VNEYTNSKKYNNLHLVEFKEMLCRISLLVYPDLEGKVEEKVFKLLGYIWENRYEKGTWDRSRMPLVPICTDNNYNITEITL